jgi:hypothetical protein
VTLPTVAFGGIAGLSITGGLIIETGGLTVTGNTQLSADLNVAGNAAIDDGLTVGANMQVDADLNVAGNAAITDGLTVGGNVQVDGFINISGSGVESGSGYFIQQAGPGSGAWGDVNVAVNASAGLNMVAAGFFTTSDARTKANVEDITCVQGEDWIKRGRPRTYLLNGRPSAGFIAQEDVEAGRGAAVGMVPDKEPMFAEGDEYARPGYRLIRDYEHDIAYLTAALQSALARIEALESR